MILSSTEQLPNKPTRIISLVPSQTELLHYLGLETETIAITKFCVHPGIWLHKKTIIGGTKNINIEKIITLQPNLIIANKEENVKEQVELLATHFPVWVTDINNLNDACSMIRDIGLLTRKEEEASGLIDSIKTEFDSVFQTTIKNSKIPAAYLIWKDPYITVGDDTFINSMMIAAGFRNVFENLERYPEITMDQLRTNKCELILLSSEPYPFKQKHKEVLQKELPGIKIILVDGEMFSWYGSRLLQASKYITWLRQNV